MVLWRFSVALPTRKAYFRYFVSWWTNSKVKNISMSSFVKKKKLHMVYTLTMTHIRVDDTSLSIILTFHTILPVRIFSWSPSSLRMAWYCRWQHGCFMSQIYRTYVFGDIYKTEFYIWNMVLFTVILSKILSTCRA